MQPARALGLEDEPAGGPGVWWQQRGAFDQPGAAGALPELLPEMQIVHISGNLDWPEVESCRPSWLRALPVELLARYHAYPYLHERDGRSAGAADLVLSRLGLPCLGEFPLFGLPAILVPYPHAWRYQQMNAQYLAENGAAQIINDEDLATRLARSCAGWWVIRESWRPCGSDASPGPSRGCPQIAGHPGRCWEVIGMMTLTFAFWSYSCSILAVMGAMRGWAKELLVTFSVSCLPCLSLQCCLRFVPPIGDFLATATATAFWVQDDPVDRAGLLWLPDAELPKLASAKFMRDECLGRLSGFLHWVLERCADRWHLVVFHGSGQLSLSSLMIMPSDDTALILNYLPTKLAGHSWNFIHIAVAIILFVLVIFVLVVFI